ncbi:MAG: DoxX family membrane protein [Chitinophagaceae bacterium]|nr:DoxX family membrane protein [Chitinophagaceae bacterium]
MNYAQRIELWGDRHHPKWLDIVRVLLGIFLCYKGFEFLNNINVLQNSISDKLSSNAFGLTLLSHYVLFAHIMGGILLILGILTRVACIIQIPVLLGAIFFVKSSGNIFRPFSELWLAIIVLLLLIYFLIIGNGPWSLKRFIEAENA